MKTNWNTGRRRPTFVEVVCALVLGGCDRSPSDLRDWKTSDHDHVSSPGESQVEVRADAGSPLARHGIDEVTIVTWQQNCTRCHGPLGAGDGPQGPMTRARDLSDPDWQSRTSDEAMVLAIRQGRGSMPAFQLPEATLKSLVKLVRLFDARRKSTPADPP